MDAIVDVVLLDGTLQICSDRFGCDSSFFRVLLPLCLKEAEMSLIHLGSFVHEQTERETNTNVLS